MSVHEAKYFWITKHLYGSICKFIMFVYTYMNHCTKLQQCVAILFVAVGLCTWTTVPFFTLKQGLLRLAPSIIIIDTDSQLFLTKVSLLLQLYDGQYFRGSNDVKPQISNVSTSYFAVLQLICNINGKCHIKKIKSCSACLIGQYYMDQTLKLLTSAMLLLCTDSTQAIVMCDTYRYIKVSRYFENIVIRYSKLVYRYFY